MLDCPANYLWTNNACPFQQLTLPLKEFSQYKTLQLTFRKIKTKTHSENIQLSFRKLYSLLCETDHICL